MLASVLNSVTAITASIAVVDAFVRLRELLSTHADETRSSPQTSIAYAN